MCGRQYRDWSVAPADWPKVPPAAHGLVLRLCEEHFHRLMAVARPETPPIRITHDLERRRWAHWHKTKDEPPHHAHIRFEHDFIPETMWCAVLRATCPNHFEVRLLNDSPVQAPLRWGKKLLASWDGQARHFGTGRPVLEPCYDDDEGSDAED
jgi:hypothetical protein